jgi:DNA-binding NarL/FixJ family response regulator
LGLRTALEAFPDLQVVAEADTYAATFDCLGECKEVVDLVVLELAINCLNPNQLSGLSLCQQLKTQYPNLPILLFTSASDPTKLRAAQQLGVEGYCPKGCSIALLVQVIRQVISGHSYWQTVDLEPLNRGAIDYTSNVPPPRWHHQMRQQGLQQIEDALAQVIQQLQNPHLSTLNWLFWSGRRRELLAARWVVNQLLPTNVIVVERNQNQATPERNSPDRARALRSQSSILKRQIRSDAEVTTNSQLSRSSQPSTPFEVTLIKLQSCLSNLSGIVLEIDILQTEKKQDLLYIVLRKFEGILEELHFSQVTVEQLPQKRSRLLQDLWQVSLTEFFGKYYTLPVGNDEFEVVNVLLNNAIIVQDSILDKIPLVVELLSQQLFQTPLMIDNILYTAQTPEAMARAEMILQNLVIQVANAVIQPLLNEFSDIERIKQGFYHRSLISSREIARFRNNLSWRYRLVQLVIEPQAIFESRYNLLVLSDTGIKQTSIYAPRRHELDQLRGIPLVITFAYETRDAIAPRLRAAIAWVGRGVVYVLTQVLGRSIGLVARGVIQGIGSSLQETRFGKNSERGK